VKAETSNRRLRLPRGKTWRVCVLLALAILAAVVAPVAAASTRSAEESLEYNLKAAFLFNFTKFVDWPADAGNPAYPDEKAPFQLCVLGEDPFGKSLDDLVLNETVNGRPIAVRRLPRGTDPRSCQILFLGRMERERQAEILGGLRGLPVLTVGESDRFLADGGLISFFLDARRVRFEISLANVDRSRLKISSKLLRLAKLAALAPLTPEERH
jgi:hypothetical protein